jgi:hypothetical protein
MTFSAVRSASSSSGSAGLLTESLAWMIGAGLAVRGTGELAVRGSGLKNPVLPAARKKLLFWLPARVTDAECAFFVVFAAVPIV